MSLALAIADAINRTPDGIDLGPTDSAEAATALRFYASRWHRRGRLVAAAALVATLAFALG